MKRIIAMLIFAMLLGIPFLSSASGPDGLVGSKAPALQATDCEGRGVDSGGLLKTHSVLVVNFWGLRCGACLQEIPHLSELATRHKGKVAVVGINSDGVDGDFLKKQIGIMNLSFSYPVVPDPDFNWMDSFKVTAVPLTYLMDSSGTVRYRHENFQPGDEAKIEEQVRSLLAASPK